MPQPQVLIISPALANANNGNWQTASRWARHLRARYAVRIASGIDGIPARTMPDAVIALHARRSAPAIAALRERGARVPLALVLTGTDLYRDIRDDASARRSLELADRLVVLQDAGVQELPAHLRAKTCVIFQSAPSLPALAHPVRKTFFQAIMVGHLREEKDPATFMLAATCVAERGIRFLQVGNALDEALAAAAARTSASARHYRWIGGCTHGRARRLLRHADLLVLPSRMEGGANVIIEAVTSGVPVVASDISGNRGMLGDDYAGYFPPGDARALAALVRRAATDAGWYALLQSQCAARAPLFAPERERAAVLELVDNLVQPPARPAASAS